MIIDKIKNRIIREKTLFLERKDNKTAKKLILNGQRPIYHVHVRKTAGTTINFSFLSNASSHNTEEFYESISRKSNHRQIKNNKVFIGWNVRLINEGYFSYAFSHTPLHQLNLASDIFTFTCLRDPVKRVVSHYNMLRYFQVYNIKHPCMKIEEKWLGDTFEDFISNLPQEHLMNQIHMFSKDFDIHEAKEKLLSLDKVIYTENLIQGLKELELMTNWHLPISHQKNYAYKEEISSNQLNELRNKLIAEYELLEMIQKNDTK